MTDNTASKLPGLKAPSKLQRPGIPKIATATTTTNNQQPTKQNTEAVENTGEFKVGDRIFVNGNKSGVVAYIGEAKFKEGEWAGVILDTTDGKNNGTVDGVTYFQTDENRGIFCRLNKLTRNTTGGVTNNKAENENSLDNSFSSTNQQATTTTATTYDLKVGDRVIVNSNNGIKKGYLRFIGPADFAKGDWAGVELDEKLGKNDGSVNGVRYFQCEALFGVFAPMQKVQKLNTEADSSAKTRSNSITKLQTPSSKLATSTINKTSLTKKNSGSQESLVSMRSERSSLFSASASVTNPMKKSLAQAKLSVSNLNAAPSTAAKKPPVVQPVIQQSLREKEGQINQLLKERDFERAEFTKAAQKFEQTESKLIDFTKQIQLKDNEILKLSQTVNDLSVNLEALKEELNKNQTTIEDLEFQLEEHKLGLNKNKELMEEDQKTDENKTDELIKQIQFEQEASKKHIDEIKLLREQVELHKNEVRQYRENESRLTSERDEIYKNLEFFEEKIKMSQHELNENLKLKELVKSSELNDKYLQDEIEKLKFLIDENDIKKCEYESRIKELEEDKGKVEHSLHHIQDSYKKHEVKFIELNTAFSELEAKYLLSEQLNGKLSDIERFNQELVSKVESGIMFEKQVEDYKKTNEELHNRVQELLNSLDEKSSQLDRLSTFNGDKDAKLDEFKSSIEKMNSEINELKEQKLVLEKNLTSATQDSESRINELVLSSKNTEEKHLKIVEELNLTIQSNTVKLDEANKVIKSLEEKNVAVEAQLEDNKKSNSDLQQRISELLKNSGDNSSQLVSLNENLKQKEQSIEELQMNISNLNQELTRTRDETNKLNNELNCAKNENDETVEKLKIKESEKLSLVEELEKVKTEFNQINEELINRIKEFEDKNVVLVGQLEEAKNTNSALEIRISELLNSNTSDSDRLNSLNTELKDKEKLIDQLKEEKVKLENQLKDEVELRNVKENEMLNNQKNSENQVLDLNEQISSLKQQIEQNEKEIGKRSDEITAHLKDIEGLKNDIENGKQNYDELNRNYENVRKTFEEKLNESQAKIQNYEDNEIKNLRNELMSLQTDKSVYENELKTVKELYSKLVDEKESLKNELNALKNNNTDKERLEMLNTELIEFKKKVQDLEQRNQTAQRDFESRETHLKDILSETDHENETKTRQIQQLTSQVESIQNDLVESKILITKYENDYIILKEELNTLKNSSLSDKNDETSTLLEKENEDLRSQNVYFQSIVTELQQRLLEYETMFADAQETNAEESEMETAADQFKLKAPRLFCDICDEFDLHDTEDCPQQAMALKEQSNHSMHNINNKNTKRLYCDNCETFDHDTNDAKCPNRNENRSSDDDQTF